MRALLIYVLGVVSMLALIAAGKKTPLASVCWCWPPAQKTVRTHAKGISQEFAPIGSYGTDADWSNADQVILLDYSQAQGKRLFYQYCVWCHADSTPAGPSNRSNVTPEPPLLNDATFLKGKSDDALKLEINSGGSALGKSAMMPAYGSTLSQADIHDLVAYMRRLASASSAQAPSNMQSSIGSRPQ